MKKARTVDNTKGGSVSSAQYQGTALAVGGEDASPRNSGYYSTPYGVVRLGVAGIYPGSLG